MKILSFLPNTLTFLNLFFGCIAIVFGINGDLKSLAIFVLLGMFCDFFDGFFARLLNVKSELGVQLDSLSDLITFGMSSSIVMFILLSNSSQIVDSNNPFFKLIPYLSFLITIASSYRLANFNLNNNETHFNGLPTPANALLIIFLPNVFEIDFLNNYTNLLENSLFLVIITLISSYLLISKIEMPSLKFQGIFTNSVKKSNSSKHFFLIFSMGLIIVFNLSAFPIIILGYVLIGLFRIKF